MARQAEPTVGRQRLVALASVAGLAAATAFAFGRVFLGRVPTWELVAAALASVLIAAAFERRSLVVALLASAIGLAFAITWIVLPQTAWYGLPSIRTWRALGRSLEFVAQQARVQVAPTPPLPPLLLAALTATWTASFSTHALAIRAGSPLLAVLPSVALVGFADTVMDDGARPIYALVFLMAVLAVVFSDGLRRVREWGPVWSAFRSRGLSRVASHGARKVALVAVLVALLVPGMLPGFRARALVDFSTGGSGGVGLDPFVSIQAFLDPEREAQDLFEVTSPGGDAYWRLYALDTFNGTDWTSSDPFAERSEPIASPAELEDVLPATERITQDYRIVRDLEGPWLPVAYPVETVTLEDGRLRYQPDLGSIVLEEDVGEGMEYSVTSAVVSPTAEQLDLVRFGPSSVYGVYTFVPSSVDARVEVIARRWAGEGSPYRQVLALQNHFRDGSFRYTLDVDPVASDDADAILTFLTETRAGFCQQFATAMAVMARSLGYPARVAVGFRSAGADGDTYLVNSRGAHAWVEVFFPGYGWLPFEPTPGRAIPGESPPSDPVLEGEGTEGGTLPGGEIPVGEVPTTGCSAGAGPIRGQLCNVDPRLSGRPDASIGDVPLPPGLFQEPGGGTGDGRGYSIPYRWIFVGILAFGLLLLVVVPIAKSLWRHRLVRRAKDPRRLVLAAYRVFDGEAADLGLGRREGETLEEHRARLSASIALSDGHLGRLTARAARAAYGASDPSPEDASEAVRDARTSIADLRRDVGWVRRVIGTYRPGL
jgi:transglutaminase-like putative cysteine protease